jgi:tRNA A37 threonylcarbamoyladenosine synthetase subunit TsaC/SUA5/YrdC
VLANVPSTIIDLSGPAPAIIRHGAGPTEPFGL